MSVIQLFLIAVLTGLFILHFLRNLWSRKHYPPGPLPLPVIGGIWRIGIKLYQDTLTKPMKKSGKTEQRANHFLRVATIGKASDVFSPVHIWKQQEKIGQCTLQKLRTVKKSIEQQAGEEAHRLVEIFAQAKGEPLDPLSPLINSVSSMICTVAFARQYSIKDKAFRKLTEELERALKSGGSFIYALHRMLPLVMRCLPGPPKKALSSREFARSFIKKEIKNYKGHWLPRAPEDFVGLYLLQMEKVSIHCVSNKKAYCFNWSLENRSFFKKEGYISDLLKIILAQVTFKHLDFTTNTLVSRDNNALVPFQTMLVQMHVKSSVSSFQGTFMNPNLNSILLDPKHWETPEEFNPNHFWDKDAKFVAGKEFLLFGASDSVDLEEQLARIEFFTFFTALLRAFRFQLPGEVKKHCPKTRVGLTTYPHSYELCAVPRCSSPQTITQ
ncbi:hypothetical protein JRQ81_017715 [Phrynocephalus forsythii]|uniref:Uncharacterized protein n=1 Tax=Phrynocephalus forsythii TaxID=171643 RepID=A0A9Q0XTC9_9SAUR|nr:hypothetical protein JRQ81_017715 [Phrynocephalus forsythii]